MGRKVFLSYCRRDVRRVRRLEETLDSLDHQVWRDRKLSGGQAWWQQILDSVRAADTFLLAVSSSSKRSLACQRELEWALALRKPILPVLIAGNDAAMPPALHHLQYVDYRDGAAPQVAALSRALALLPPAPAIPESEPLRPSAPPAKPVVRVSARLGWAVLAVLVCGGGAGALLRASRSPEEAAIAPAVVPPSERFTPAASAERSGTAPPTPEPRGATTTSASPRASMSSDVPKGANRATSELAKPSSSASSSPSGRDLAPPASSLTDRTADLKREVQNYVAGSPLQLEPALAASLASAWVEACGDTHLASLQRAVQLRFALPAQQVGARCEQARMAIGDVRCLRAWRSAHLPHCALD